MAEVRETERFTKAPVALIGLVESKVIKQFDYLLWHVLWSFSDSVTRRCFPAQGTLAKATASKRDTVRDGLKRLEDAGVIVCVVRHPKGSRKPNTYQIVDDVAKWRVSPAPSSGHEDISHGADRGHEEKRHGTDQDHEGLVSHGTHRGHEESSWPPSGSRHGTERGHDHDPHRGHYQEPKNKNHEQEGSTFEDLIAAHPRPSENNYTRRAWDQLIEEGHDASEIVAWAGGYADAVKGSDPQYIKGMSGWLSEKHWQSQPGKLSYEKRLSEGHRMDSVIEAMVKRARNMGDMDEVNRVIGDQMLDMSHAEFLSMLDADSELIREALREGLASGARPNSY